MKLRKKLSNLLVLIFAVCIMSFGIYAAQTASLTMTGTVGFVAHECEVEVYGTISNAIRDKNLNFAKVSDKIYEINANTTWYDKYCELDDNGNYTDNPVYIKGDTEGVWSVGDIFFDDIYNAPDADVSPIIITLDITNLSAFPINTIIDLGEVASNTQITTYAPTSTKILKDQTKTVKIVFTLTDKSQDVTTNIDLTGVKITFEKTNDLTTDPVDEDDGWVVTNQGELIGVPTAEDLDTDNLIIPNIVYKDINQTFTSTAKTMNNSLNANAGKTPITVTSIGLMENNQNPIITDLHGFKKVTIPEGVFTLGNNAFLNCTTIENVILPENLQTIQSNVFTGCTNLKFNVFNSGTYLGHGSNTKFALIYGPANADSISFSGDTKIIANDAFRNVSFDKVTIEPGATVIPENLFQGTDVKEVVVPETVDEIKDNTFEGCEDLTDVKLPDSLNSIGNNAFNGCTNLTDIKIPANLESIGDNAFANTGLTEVTVPQTVTSIGTNAFTGSNVSNVTINGNNTVINDSAFKECSNLSNVTINSSYVSIGNNVFKNNTNLTNVQIKGNSSIGSNAFDNCQNLINVTFNGPVESIGDNSFNNCPNLNKVTFNDSVDKIGDGAFKDTTNLTDVNLSKGIDEIGDGAFENSGVEEVVLPDNVQNLQVGNNAFTGSALRKLVMNGNIRSIGDYAFYYCQFLEEVVITGTVGIVGKYAFSNCLSLQKFHFGFEATTLKENIFKDSAKLRTVIISNSKVANSISESTSVGYLTAYANMVFVKEDISVTTSDYLLNKDNFTVVELDQSEITEYSGYKKYLSNINLQATVSAGWTISQDGVLTSVPTSANLGSTNLVIPAFVLDEANSREITVRQIGAGSVLGNISGYKTIKMPETIEVLGAYVFSECTNITSVEFPQKIKTINAYAFNGCTGLTEISFSEGLKTLGEYSFYKCSNLKQLNLPNSLTSAGKSVFDYCTSLVEVEVPTGLADIPQDMFQHCSCLKKATFNGDILTMGEGIFDLCSSLETLIFKGDVKQIGYSMCVTTGDPWNPCTNLKTVTFEKTIERIDNIAFWGCSSIEEITLPGIKYIDYQAFMNCTNLKKVTIIGDVTINYEAFNGCTSLNAVQFIGTLNSIGDKTFNGCTSLQTINIPDGITSIGTNAFASCKNLKTIIVEDKTVANNITSVSVYSGLFANATTIYIKNTITKVSDSTYLDNCFNNNTSDKENYNMYVKTVKIKYNAEKDLYYVYMGTYSGSTMLWSIMGYYEDGTLKTYDQTAFENNVTQNLMLISYYAIEQGRVMHSNKSDLCNFNKTDLYKYLNGTFYTNCFTDEERNLIQDRTYNVSNFSQPEANLGSHPTKVTSKVWILNISEVHSLNSKFRYAYNKNGQSVNYWTASLCKGKNDGNAWVLYGPGWVGAISNNTGLAVRPGVVISLPTAE